jgi:hypothetical protein
MLSPTKVNHCSIIKVLLAKDREFWFSNTSHDDPRCAYHRSHQDCIDTIHGYLATNTAAHLRFYTHKPTPQEIKDAHRS